jgi:predicted nucleotidyltransferase
VDAREALAQLELVLDRQLGSDLVGLYLFGSLATGAFYPGKSDLDLIAVVETQVEEGDQLEALRGMHDVFVTERPEWVERIEVSYVDREVLQTFGGQPSGRLAVISPGEPLHVRDAGYYAVLDWYGVCRYGETLSGPPPLDLGPEVTPSAFRHAVEETLREWPSRVSAPWVAYVPAHQGYVVVTLCRALYALATGEQTDKETAAAWAAARFPESATFIQKALATYRADVQESHQALIAFTDHVLAEAERLG